MKRRIYQLDVFTNRPYEGNPLAVVTDGDGLSQSRMQAIAREMNLPETVFVQKPTASRALARLRIFTTQEELPLAGHPVIGTWFLLAELGVVPAQEGAIHVWQQTGAGVLPVEVEFRSGRPVRVTMTQKPAQFRAVRISRAALGKALDLRAADFEPALPLEEVSTGIFNLMVPLRSRAALGRIRLDLRELTKAMGKSGTVAYCFALTGRGRVQSRGMLPWAIGEDPATGSAGGSLGAYLVHHGRLAAGQPLDILQGAEMGRPSRIRVVIQEVNRKLVPRVSGSAVRILEGTLEG